MRVCDANVVLRYILDDIPEQASIAAKIIDNENVYIPFEVVAEIVYVLEKVYRIPRRVISTSIRNLLRHNTIQTVDKTVAFHALDVYKDTKLDIVDAFLCGYQKKHQHTIVTFDKKLLKQLSRMKSSSRRESKKLKP